MGLHRRGSRADGARVAIRAGSALLLLAAIVLPIRDVRAATDAPTAYRFLDDLKPGPFGSYPPFTTLGVIEPSAHSGSNYFIPVQRYPTGDPIVDSELVELYVTDGRSESGHILDGIQIPSQVQVRTGYNSGITPFGDGSVLFIARNGDEPDLSLLEDEFDPLEMRLFVSDGIDATPLIPAGFTCSDAAPTPCGFYRLMPAMGLPPETPPLVATSQGAAFIGAWYDGEELGKRLPYLIVGDAMSYSVSQVDADSGLAGDKTGYSSWAGMVLAIVGDILYADLAKEGSRGLYAADLHSYAPAWIAPPATTTVDRSRPSNVGDYLYFNGTVTGQAPGQYAARLDPATSPSFTVVRVGDKQLHGAAAGSTWFSWTKISNSKGFTLVRSTLGNSTEVVVSFPEMPTGALQPRVWSTGDTVYFIGAQPATAATATATDGIYRLAPGDVAPVQIFATPAQLGDGILVAPYDGNLYFTSPEPPGGTGPPQLFAYSGSGTPSTVTKVNGSADAGFQFFAQIDDLFVFWANDGIHGYEPWAADVLRPPLAVSVIGPGEVTSEPARFNCTAFCTEEFRFGSTVTLTAVGAGFVGWTSNCTPISATSCTVTMDGGKDVAAVFAEPGDVLGVAADGTTPYQPGGTIEYSVVVGNVTAAPVGPVTLTGTLTGGATLDQGKTPWCAPAGAAAFSCPVSSIPASSARVLKVFATAPASGTVGATFAIGNQTGETVTDNNTAIVGGLVPLALAAPVAASFLGGISVQTVSDRFSTVVGWYPSQAGSGGALPYGVRIRNVGAAAGAVLHVGFAGVTVGRISAGGLRCKQDASPAPGFLVSASCPISRISAGSEYPVSLSAVAPSVTGGDVGLSATFWVTYGDGPDGDPTNDRTAATGTTIVATTPDDRRSTQAILPLTSALQVTTLDGGAPTSLDPSGVSVAFGTGFTGYVSSLETSEATEATEATGASALLSASGRGPKPFPCSDRRGYSAGCLGFSLQTVASADSARVVEVRFAFDATTFVNRDTLQSLPVSSAVFFVSTDGGLEYTRVAACPRRATAATYTGAAPCLLSVVQDRAGDYIFTVLTSTGGLWKAGA